MKNRIAIIAAALMLVAGVSIAEAQGYDSDEDIKINVGAKAGWFFFQDDPLSETLENNWIIGGELKVWFNRYWGIGGEVQFLTKDEEDATTSGNTIDVEVTQIPIHANLYYRFPGEGKNMTPYIGGGVSFVFTDITASGFLDTGVPQNIEVDDTPIGINVIGGVEFAKNFFVEGQWYWAESNFDGELQMLDDEDVNVGGFNLFVGVRF